MKTNRAFTLAELLVVIAIMSMLLALLLPALGRSKESARAVACRSNLRQLGIAVTLYSAESGYFPAMEYLDTSINPFVTFGWPAKLLPQVSSNVAIFKCPTTSAEFAWPTNRSSRGYAFPYNIGNDTKFSYGYNGWGVASIGGFGLGENPDIPVPITRIKHPSAMIAIGDSTGDGGRDGWISFHRFRQFLVAPPGTRHSQGANIVFCDGHVEWQKQGKWIELTDAAARRWNNDNEPHRNLWISR